MEPPSLRFEIESSIANGEVAREDKFHGEAIHVDSLQGTVKKTITARLRLGAETLALFFVREGTTLVWGEADKRWFVMPPHSVTYIRGPLSLVLNLARGGQEVDVISFHSKNTPFLAEWLDKNPGRQGKSDRPRVMATMPYRPFFHGAMERLDLAVKGAPEMLEPALFSILYDIIPRLVRSRSRMGLAPIPVDLPANISSLIQQVRQRPDLPWPLKDAAEHVGYSPFHFSRIYKSLVGYGFHEFVDRCRTEHAVDLLCTSDTPIDVVAAASGFGTTQALRESVKEYLGLVPSELRSAPEDSSSVR